MNRPGSRARPRLQSRSPSPTIAASVAVVAILLPSAARAEFRHALVIGQSAYKTGTLAAGPRDVAVVAEALVKQGFTVTKAEDVATTKALGDAVNAFAGAVPTGGTALVYFSGHAVTVPVVSGTNPPRSDLALVTLDGGRQPLNDLVRRLARETQQPNGLIRHDVAKGQPACGSRMHVVILDTSRPPTPTAAQPPAAADPPPTPPHVDLPPDSLILLPPADAAARVADVAGPSLLAGRLASAVSAGRPLDAALAGLSSRTLSSLAPADLARLAGPASRAASPRAAVGPGSRPGDEWVDASGMVFCWCPPGEFTIGSPETEKGRYQDEVQAVVSFAEGFWMAKHELCAREWSMLGGNASHSTGGRKLDPVNLLITAGEVAACLTQANAVAPPGWEYGLPTEAEWEYAARAGTKTSFSFGDDPADLVRHGNFADRSLRESDAMSESARSTTPHRIRIFNGDPQTGIFAYAHRTWSDGTIVMARVGSYLPNPWGLCDMHGNVAEVTTATYDSSRLAPAVLPQDREAWGKRPENAKFDQGQVCKGGSWASEFTSCRSAFRGLPNVKEYILGLRLVLRRAGSAAAPPATRWTTLVPGRCVTSSGATAATAADGTILVTGTIAKGDVYTVTCPVPAGIEPRDVKLELLTDPSLPNGGPGRAGSYSVAEVSIAGVRAGMPPAAFDVLDVRSAAPRDVRSEVPTAPSGSLVDGKPDTVWNGQGQGKENEVVFTVGLPSRTGYDAARWRYPVAAATVGPLESLVVTITHRHDAPATIGKFRIAVLHEHDERKETTP